MKKSSSISELLDAISVKQNVFEPLDENKAKDEERDYELQQKKEIILDQQQDRDERKKYADKIFNLIWLWLLAVISLVLANGCEANFGAITTKFNVSEKVLIAIIMGTTINILGLFIIVAKYLFHRSR